METLGIIGSVMSVVSGVTGFFGNMQQGNATAAALNYQAQVAANNAKIAQQNAAWETQIGEQQATTSLMKGRAIIGAEKAGQAASGIDVNTGSAVDVRAGETGLQEENAMIIRSNAARKAYGFESEATSFAAQQRLDLMEAAQAKSAGMTSGIGSLLGGAASGASKYAQWQLQSGGGGGGYSPVSVA